MSQLLTFNRYRSTPVLAKGGTYDGWTADALANPSVTRNLADNGWVMLVGMWNIAAGKWSTGFFTSTDLETWSYVTGSLRSPGGSNYILGNGGILAAQSGTYSGLYIFTYSTYPSATLPLTIYMDTSPDLVTWTNRSTDLLPAGAYDNTRQADTEILWNPYTSKFEVWYTCNSLNTAMGDSSDGSTWTKNGVQFTQASVNSIATTDCGETNPFYYNSNRFITFDGSTTGGSGHRHSCACVDPTGTGGFFIDGIVLSAEPANAWEAAQVFDQCCVGAVDRGDGLGTKLWMLYAGSDGTSPTDNTNSSFGLVYADLPPSIPIKPAAGTALNTGKATYTNLVSAWLFQENTGDPADSVNATVAVGTGVDVTWVPGYFGHDLAFNGFGILKAPLVSGWNANAMTIMVWFQTVKTGAQELMRRDNGTTKRHWLLRQNSSNKIEFIPIWGAIPSIASSASFNDGKIHCACVVFVYDGSTNTNCELFVDNVSQGTCVVAGAQPSSDLQLAIGGYATSSDIELFTGKLDLPMIWNADIGATNRASMFADPLDPWRAGGGGLVGPLVGQGHLIGGPLVGGRLIRSA